jgi:calcineurin-like phosphoesterase family protein
MHIWFTSDTHFGHANIIRHCRRPFASVEEMDAEIIRRINERVGPEDLLYHLGDFSFRGGDPAAYRARIKCRRIVLLLGNHDPQTRSGAVRPEFAGLFHEVHSLLRIKVPVAGVPQLIVLCHYAMRVWDRAHHGAWHLFGHSHGSLPDDPCSRSWDVGVDRNNFAPLSLEEVTGIMASKTFQPVDHHRPTHKADPDGEADAADGT